MRPGPRLLVYFCNRLIFYGEEFLTPRPTPKLEDHLLPAVRDCLFDIFAAALQNWRASPPSATWGRAMPWWQGTHLTWSMTSTLFKNRCRNGCSEFEYAIFKCVLCYSTYTTDLDVNEMYIQIDSCKANTIADFKVHSQIYFSSCFVQWFVRPKTTWNKISDVKIKILSHGFTAIVCTKSPPSLNRKQVNSIPPHHHLKEKKKRGLQGTQTK
jgi:hypothetical protein